MNCFEKARTEIDRVLLIEYKDREVDYSVEKAQISSDECFRVLCGQAAHVLMSSRLDPYDDGLTEGEALDPLSIERFTSDRDNTIIDIDVTVGGPTVRLRYESLWRMVTITADWGADHLEIRSKDAPICQLLEWM